MSCTEGNARISRRSLLQYLTVVVQAEQYDYEKYVKDNVRYAKQNTLNKAPLSEFVFEAGAYENTELDTFNNPVRVETAYNGTLQTCATYDADGKRTSLTDGVTGIVTATEYDALDRVNKVTAGEAVQTTEYNADGNVASKTLSENGKETKYVYAYKDNAAKELKSVTVGDVTVSPTTDMLGRATGKAIEVNGKKIAEEHIAYRKVGDHATNMPSTIRFGNVLAKNTASSVLASGTASSVIPSVAEESSPVIASEAKQSQFVHLDNLKYTYDSCGTVVAKDFATKKQYDKIPVMMAG